MQVGFVDMGEISILAVSKADQFLTVSTRISFATHAPYFSLSNLNHSDHHVFSYRQFLAFSVSFSLSFIGGLTVRLSSLYMTHIIYIYPLYTSKSRASTHQPWHFQPRIYHGNQSLIARPNSLPFSSPQKCVAPTTFRTSK